MTVGWHASPRRGVEWVHDSATGEVRVPLRLLNIDVHQGYVDLVLTSDEVAGLLKQLESVTGESK